MNSSPTPIPTGCWFWIAAPPSEKRARPQRRRWTIRWSPALTAGQKGQIVYLDPAALYLSSGGVQSLTLLLKQVTEAFGAANS